MNQGVERSFTTDLAAFQYRDSQYSSTLLFTRCWKYISSLSSGLLTHSHTDTDTVLSVPLQLHVVHTSAALLYLSFIQFAIDYTLMC